MKGTIAITCTETIDGQGGHTKTNIDCRMQMRRSEKLQLMLNIANALELEPDDWIALSMLRLAKAMGAGGSDGDVSTKIDITALKDALGRAEGEDGSEI